MNETGLKGVRDFVVLPSIPGKAEILRHEWILRLAIDLGSKFEPGKAPRSVGQGGAGRPVWRSVGKDNQ